MPPVGFEPTISAVERPRTYALDRAAIETGTAKKFEIKNLKEVAPHWWTRWCFAPSPANTLVLFKSHRLIQCVHKSRTKWGYVETKYRILGSWIRRDNWRYFTSVIVKPHLVRDLQYMCRALNPRSIDELPFNKTYAVTHDKPTL